VPNESECTEFLAQSNIYLGFDPKWLGNYLVKQF